MARRPPDIDRLVAQLKRETEEERKQHLDAVPMLVSAHLHGRVEAQMKVGEAMLLLDDDEGLARLAAHAKRVVWPATALRCALRLGDKQGRAPYDTLVKVLRSANRLLDDAAMTAVRQWQYRPLILNGLAEPFVLTVVLTFNIADS